MTGVASWMAFAQERLPELGLRIAEHLMLTGVSTSMAIMLGIPIGICAAKYRILRSPLTGVVAMLQTIPSLAMLAILLALLNKIGAFPAIIALTLYALLPIVRNTLSGLEGVAPSIQEAARGIGMTPRQQLWLVELPLALPVIIAGIRTAAVVGVGIATLSAFIGAGGLGQFINRGLALSNTSLILLGAIPAGILALLVDGSIAAFQWGLRRNRSRERRTPSMGWLDRWLRPLAILAPVGLLIIGCSAWLYSSQGSLHQADGLPKNGTIRIGSKNFTEQLILGELMAQLIETKTKLQVERRFNLGGTMICHGALVNGEIDLYAEYSGTALTVILNLPAINGATQVQAIVAREYEKRFSAKWLTPFGFNNTYTIAVRKSDATSHNLQTISDLVPIGLKLRAGFTDEFSERPDGYPGLRETYGLQFGEVRDLGPNLMYQAMANHEVDVICAFATDGRIASFNLHPLEDDKGLFPPYQAIPVARLEILQKYPELLDVINLLGGLLDDATMQRLNYEADEKKQSPADIAHEFLIQAGLL